MTVTAGQHVDFSVFEHMCDNVSAQFINMYDKGLTVPVILMQNSYIFSIQCKHLFEHLNWVKSVCWWWSDAPSVRLFPPKSQVNFEPQLHKCRRARLVKTPTSVVETGRDADHSDTQKITRHARRHICCIYNDTGCFVKHRTLPQITVWKSNGKEMETAALILSNVLPYGDKTIT